MRRIVLLMAFLAGVSSCASCESCGSGSNANADATAAPPTVATEATQGSASASASAAAPPPVLDAKASCRLLAREITQKACNCPQGNHVGCCFFGLEPLKAFDAAAPHLECSRGKTDWPASLETRLCANTADVAKATAIANCYAARDKLQCARSPNGDTGAGLPKACESLFTMLETAK